MDKDVDARFARASDWKLRGSVYWFVSEFVFFIDMVKMKLKWFG
jgi:hypothetical protein